MRRHQPKKIKKNRNREDYKEVTADFNLNNYCTTQLYGLTAADYGFSNEYADAQQNQDEYDSEFINKAKPDPYCGNALDGYYGILSLLEQDEANCQTASHDYTAHIIEQLAHRDIFVSRVVNEMLEVNEAFMEDFV